MPSPNNPNSQIKPTNQCSNLDSSDFSTLSGDGREDAREDEPFGDADREEGLLDCETQVLDFGDETQLVHLDEEMQDTELAGETQVMDDYDFFEKMDTQLIDLSDNETECRSYKEEGEGTQLLHDTDEIHSDCDNRTHNNWDDGEATTESLSSFDTELSTGQKKTSKNADGELCSSEFKNESVNAEKVNVGRDMKQRNDKGLSNENKSKVNRSLAEDNSEEGSRDSLSGQRTDTHLFSSCHEELARLSYVDSQEPGELSQANAMEFIEKFLKVNVLESDQDKTLECAIGEIVTPGTIAKGPQSLAQQTNRRSTITGTTVFDWDDTQEDGGGGEFFIKKKKQLIETSCRAQKCSSKSLSSRRPEPEGAELAGKHKNEKEQKNIHKKVRQSIHSASKLVKSKKMVRLKKTKGKKKIDDNTDQLLASDCGDREVPVAELVDVADVGIDTQMAAEAMEVLSTGRALLTIDSSIADEDQEIGIEMCEKGSPKKGMQNKRSVGKRTCLSRSHLGIRSTRTKPSTSSSHEEPECSIALRTRSKFAVGEFNGDLLKTKSNQRLDMKSIRDLNEQEPPGIEPTKIGDVKRAIMLEQELLKTGSLPVKKRSSPVKLSSSASTACKIRQHVNVNNLIEPDNVSGGSRVQTDCLHLEQAGRAKRKRSSTHYGAANARDEVLNVINATGFLVDGTSDGGDNTSTPSTRSAKNKPLLASVGDEVVSQFITRQTRSMCKSQSANVFLEDKSLHSGKMLSEEDHRQSSSKKCGACSPSTKEATSASAKSPEKAQKSSSPAIVTPINMKTPSVVSPICVGDEYSTPSCRKALSLKKEFYRLTSTEPLSLSPCKDLRPRRDISSVRVLFSRHLDDDIIRQQKKIMSRLGVLVASSISDATHFVADTFVRTRNMLEAIANGKPVVTHLWLDSCGQSNCFIDEKNYILRDAKKERELGFSMPNSLAQAIRHPLLEGRRVFITPNTKPGKEILASLVKAIHGLVIERLCRSLSNNDRPPDGLLVLSCEEDFRECVPLLEKGIAIYSSELLLNGIITQRMEYERYRIFVDHVKITRSSLWVKKNGEQFLPVSKAK